jgi:hypothetical protein
MGIRAAGLFREFYGADPCGVGRITQQAENAFVGMPCGILDQSASSLSAEGHLLFMDTRTLATRLIPFTPAGQAPRRTCRGSRDSLQQVGDERAGGPARRSRSARS